MRFYTITAVSNFLNRPLISAYHYDMFHGVAEREGKKSPHQRTPWASSESYSPLWISRTIRHVPEISEPVTHLVISERLAKRLGRFQNIRLAPVNFKRLVDVEWQKGDMSWATGGSHDPADVLVTLPDVPEFHQLIDSFYEVQTYRWQDVVDNYPLASEISIEQGTPPMSETEAICVSPDMLRDFPMLRRGSTIVSEEVFDILDADLDRDFFIIRKYEIP